MQMVEDVDLLLQEVRPEVVCDTNGGRVNWNRIEI
jgi:hypothetical protein